MPNVGEIWAYRSGGRKQLQPVSVESISGRRAQISFIEPSLGGKIEWVPIGRLKCTWGSRDTFLDREARWDTIQGLERPPLASRDAAWDIFFATVPTEIAEIYNNNATGVVEIHDLKRLCELTGLEPQVFVAYESSFFEDGSLYVPWEGTQLIARVMAAKAGGRLLRRIEAEERREADERARSGTSLVDSENPRTDTRWERTLASWEQSKLERREAIRRWANADPATVADEIVELRGHLERLIELSTRAAVELPQARTKRAISLASEIDELVREIRMSA